MKCECGVQYHDGCGCGMAISVGTGYAEHALGHFDKVGLSTQEHPQKRFLMKKFNAWESPAYVGVCPHCWHKSNKPDSTNE